MKTLKQYVSRFFMISFFTMMTTAVLASGYPSFTFSLLPMEGMKKVKLDLSSLEGANGLVRVMSCDGKEMYRERFKNDEMWSKVFNLSELAEDEYKMFVNIGTLNLVARINVSEEGVNLIENLTPVNTESTLRCRAKGKKMSVFFNTIDHVTVRIHNTDGKEVFHSKFDGNGVDTFARSFCLENLKDGAYTVTVYSDEKGAHEQDVELR
ncbi:hypothetical protein [Sediminitomix flava]|uniref:Uncharacterized protein n=1 Tax=Sediminitomix flava TaxID=379075 RepID=A0A315ZWL7_SEDFL|nr:hypothetical protein [Sediminitomix flava]PWJ41083.1 hypothetical protein BC781_104358 [Sediminitomix flava]